MPSERNNKKEHMETERDSDSRELEEIRRQVVHKFLLDGEEVGLFDRISQQLANEWLSAVRSGIGSKKRNELVKRQAILIWGYKGRYSLDLATDDEDYYAAERHLAALAAFEFLRADCPLQWLFMGTDPATGDIEDAALRARVGMLSSLTLHKVVQIAAYLQYRERTRIGKAGNEVSDFLAASGEILSHLPDGRQCGICDEQQCLRRTQAVLRRYGCKKPYSSKQMIAERHNLLVEEGLWNHERERSVGTVVQGLCTLIDSAGECAAAAVQVLLRSMEDELALVTALDAGLCCVLRRIGRHRAYVGRTALDRAGDGIPTRS